MLEAEKQLPIPAALQRPRLAHRKIYVKGEVSTQIEYKSRSEGKTRLERGLKPLEARIGYKARSKGIIGDEAQG